MANVRADEIQLSIDINGEKAGKSMLELKKDVATLNRELMRLPEGTEAFKKKAQELGIAKKKLKEAQKAAKEFENQQGRLTASFGKFKGMVGGLPSAFGKVGAALKSALAPLFVLTLIGELINLGREALAVTNRFQETREEVNRLTGATGDELSAFTAKISAIGTTFDQDVNTVLETSNALAKQLGIDFDESLELIEQGLLAAGGKGDEFLEQVKEYAPQLKQAGLEGAAGLEIIARSLELGVPTDKGIDAVKEFNLRIKALTKGQRDTLNDTLGKDFTDKLTTAIETGEKTSIEALNEISGKMGDLGAESADTQKIISDLFGGAGEDAGAQFIISLQEMKGSLEGVIDTSNIYVKRQIEQLELEKELATAQEDLSRALDGSGAFFKRTGTLIKTYFFNALGAVADLVRYFPEHWRIFRVRTLEALNNLGANVASALNLVIQPIRYLLDLVGVEVPKVEIGFEIDTSSAELQAKLLKKMKADRQKYAQEQERQRLLIVNKQAEAERRERLKKQKDASQFMQAQARKEAAEMAEIEAKAQNAINALMIEVMQDGIEKEIALLRLRADEKKNALTGNAKQIAEHQKLIEIQLLEQIEAIRAKNLKQEISELRAQAEQKIKALNGNAVQVANQQKQIEQKLSEDLSNLINADAQAREALLISQGEQRAALILSQDQALVAAITELEQELQAKIAELKNDDTLDEQTKTNKIKIITKEYAERRRLVISENKSINAQILQSEKALNESLKALTTDKNKHEKEANEAIKKVSLSESEKRLNEEIKLLKAHLAQKNLLETQSATESIEAGADQAQVEKDLKAALIENEIAFLESKKALQDAFGISSLETQAAIEKLKLANTKKRIKTETEEETKAQTERLAKINATIGLLRDAANALSDLNQAKLDADLAKIESNKQKELAAVGDNEDAKARIEAKYEKQKEAAQQKSARAKQKISILQTIINTAQSIVKTGAELGYPLAIPFQVIAAAIGAQQIRAIRAQAFAIGGDQGQEVKVHQKDGAYYYQGQRLSQKQDIAAGGPVNQASIGVIGEAGPEWIAPNWMLSSSEYGPIIANLERIRARGFATGGKTISPKPSFASSITKMPAFVSSFATGGLSTDTTPADASINAVQSQNEQMSEEMLTELRGLRTDFQQIKLVTLITEKKIDEIFAIKGELDARRDAGGF